MSAVFFFFLFPLCFSPDRNFPPVPPLKEVGVWVKLKICAVPFFSCVGWCGCSSFVFRLSAAGHGNVCVSTQRFCSLRVVRIGITTSQSFTKETTPPDGHPSLRSTKCCTFTSTLTEEKKKQTIKKNRFLDGAVETSVGSCAVCGSCVVGFSLVGFPQKCDYATPPPLAFERKQLSKEDF
jgi:hypothetical protein